MYDSILISVKKLLGLSEDYNYFNPDLIIDINSVLMILYQMGVGSKTPFHIEDDSETWQDFFGEEVVDINAVKTYVALKVKLMFDPPAASAHMQAIQETIKELEWRLYSAESSDNFDPDKIEDIYADMADDHAVRRKRRVVKWNIEL